MSLHKNTYNKYESMSLNQIYSFTTPEAASQ